MCHIVTINHSWKNSVRQYVSWRCPWCRSFDQSAAVGHTSGTQGNNPGHVCFHQLEKWAHYSWRFYFTTLTWENIVFYIHPLSILILGCLGGCWSRSQLALGERRGTPWTSCQSITGPTYRDRQPLTLTPTGTLVSPISLTCMSLDCGRKLEYSEKTHTGTRGTCKLHAEGPQPADGCLCSICTWNKDQDKQN